METIGIITKAYGGRISLPLSSYNNWTSSGNLWKIIDNESDIADI